MMSEKTLEVRNLTVCIPTEKGVIRPVNDVSLEVPAGRIAGIVGESGCGKSMTARAVMGLLRPPAKVTAGSVLLCGREITSLPEKERRQLRGAEMSMIFQEPMTSLNPVVKVGRQVEEVLRLHGTFSREEARAKTLEMFREVEIPEPESRIDCYPHQLSGGLRQRAMIAIALACSPKLLIADEPTTALDVTIQSQIIRLIQKLREETGMGIVFISHDMGVVASLVDRIAVFYAGQIVEQGNTRDIFRNPLHPYTAGLIKCIPRLDTESRRLYTIPGSTPNLAVIPEGCCFAPRCPYATDVCRTVKPEYTPFPGGRSCACHHAGSLEMN